LLTLANIFEIVLNYGDHDMYNLSITSKNVNILTIIITQLIWYITMENASVV